MNQPSAEDFLWEIYQMGIEQGKWLYKNTGPNNVPNAIPENPDKKIDDFLESKLIIDKTEPIPGAVSFKDIFDDWRHKGLSDLISQYDIFPKGTVARLMGEVEELKKTVSIITSESISQIRIKNLQAEVDRLKEENQKNVDDGVNTIRGLHAEVDRLKGSNRLKNLLIHNYNKKPEAVGCENFQVGKDALHSCGGPSGFVCTDCQDNAGGQRDKSQPRKIDSQYILDELEALVTAVKQFRRENEK